MFMMREENIHGEDIARRMIRAFHPFVIVGHDMWAGAVRRQDRARFNGE